MLVVEMRLWTFLVPNLLARNAIADLLSLLIIPLAPTVMVIREQAVPVSLMSLTNVAYLASFLSLALTNPYGLSKETVSSTSVISMVL